jgi:hypothetical protein
VPSVPGRRSQSLRSQWQGSLIVIGVLLIGPL